MKKKKKKGKNTYRCQKTKYVTYLYSEKEDISLEVNTKGILNFWGNRIGASAFCDWAREYPIYMFFVK